MRITVSGLLHDLLDNIHCFIKRSTIPMAKTSPSLEDLPVETHPGSGVDIISSILYHRQRLTFPSNEHLFNGKLGCACLRMFDGNRYAGLVYHQIPCLFDEIL